MSDSTIDDALRLLEIGKGNPDRLKQIIESFQKRSMISMQDRKYVDALVEQYLTPRHRQMTSKMKPSERQKTNFPRIRNLPNKIICTDNKGEIDIVYFNSREGYLRKIFPLNEWVIVSGKINFFNKKSSFPKGAGIFYNRTGCDIRTNPYIKGF